MQRWLICSLAVVAAACASATVRKVPGDIAENEKLEGVRYYLPRPYVVVKREFAVGGGTYFGTGTLSDDRQSIVLDQVPDAIKDRFAGSVLGLSSVHLPEPPDAGGPENLQQQGAGQAVPQTAATQSAETAPAPQLLADAKDFLKGSQAVPDDMKSKDDPLILIAKVSADALNKDKNGDLGGTGKLLPVLYLVPIADGKHTSEGLVKVDGKIVAQDAKSYTLTGSLKQGQAPAFASIGVGIEVQDAQGNKKQIVLHRKQRDLTSSLQGPRATGSDGGNKPAEDGKETESDKKELSGAKVSTSGDPTTDPLTRITALYDIILLPDLSEQYAIQVKSGLFSGKMDLGLENGWMLEKFSADIDNSQIGNLITGSVQKLVDVGIAAISPAAAAAEALATKPTAAPEQFQAQAAGAPVSLRFDLIQYAVPGMYPILKPSEQECGNPVKAPVKPGPCPPRVDYDTREVIVVSLAMDKPATTSTGETDAARDGTAMSGDVEAQLRNAVENALAALKSGGAYCDAIKGTPELFHRVERADGSLTVSVRYKPSDLVPGGESKLEDCHKALLEAVQEQLTQEGQTLNFTLDLVPATGGSDA